MFGSGASGAIQQPLSPLLLSHLLNPRPMEGKFLPLPKKIQIYSNLNSLELLR